MSVYHLKFETDKEAVGYAAELMSQHIFAHVSLGFGSGPAIVVAYTDDASVFGEHEYELIQENTDVGESIDAGSTEPHDSGTENY